MEQLAEYIEINEIRPNDLRFCISAGKEKRELWKSQWGNYYIKEGVRIYIGKNESKYITLAHKDIIIIDPWTFNVRSILLNGKFYAVHGVKNLFYIGEDKKRIKVKPNQILISNVNNVIKSSLCLN